MIKVEISQSQSRHQKSKRQMETKNSIHQYLKCKTSKNNKKLQKEFPKTANTQRIWDQVVTEITAE